MDASWGATPPALSRYNRARIRCAWRTASLGTRTPPSPWLKGRPGSSRSNGEVGKEARMTPEALSDTAVLDFHDGSVHFDIDLRVYRLGAVQKTAYRLARQCTAVLGEIR